MIKFALIHFRAAETDGVSLEMEKWQKVIENSGNKCVIIAGVGGDYNNSILDFRHPDIAAFTKNCFRKLSIPQKKLEGNFDKLTKKCEKALREFLTKEKPDVLIINNVLSLPISIPFAAALCNLNKEMKDISFWGFHHDFFWERTYIPTSNFVKELVKKYYPPKDIAGHLVINSLAKAELKKRKNLKSKAVDNYFDFSQINSSVPSDLRKKLNLKKNSIIFLHATRIVERKGIEFALDGVKEFAGRKKEFAGKTFYNGKTVDKNTEIVVVFPGLIEDKPYYKMIKAFAKKLGIKTIFCENLCEASKNGSAHSLWDFYKICDAVTYTSLKEGWGNQLIEALALKKPVIIFEYPVFIKDIKKFGFDLLSLGGKYHIKRNARKLPEQRLRPQSKTGRRLSYKELCKLKEQRLPQPRRGRRSKGRELYELPKKIVAKNVSRLYDILLDKKKYDKITGKNFNIAHKKLSLTALEKRISEIFLKQRKTKSRPRKCACKKQKAAL